MASVKRLIAEVAALEAKPNRLRPPTDLGQCLLSTGTCSSSQQLLQSASRRRRGVSEWARSPLEVMALSARPPHAEVAIIDAACAVRAESMAVKLRLR